MEYAQFLVSSLLFIFSMMATPGPNNATVMAVGLSCGFRATIPHCIAVTIVMPCMLLLAGSGLGQIFLRYQILAEILKYAGAAYMIWLAWGISGIGSYEANQDYEEKLLKKARKSKNNSGESTIRPLSFKQAILFQLINPKGWLTCITCATVYAGNDEYFWLRLGIMAIFMLIMGFSTIFMWAAGGVFMRRFLSSEGMRRCNYVFATFLLLSVVLLFI